MVHKNINISDKHNEQIAKLAEQHEDELKERRRNEGMTGKGVESYLFRMICDVGIPKVAELLANVSKN